MRPRAKPQSHCIRIIPEKVGDVVFDIWMTLRQAVEMRQMSFRESLHARRRTKAHKLHVTAASPDVPERGKVGHIICLSKVETAQPSPGGAPVTAQVGTC